MDKMIAYGIWIVAVIGLLMLLPSSPFSINNFQMPQALRDILGYVNWLIPFGRIANTMLAWTGAVGVYYLYQLSLRWAKAI